MRLVHIPGPTLIVSLIAAALFGPAVQAAESLAPASHEHDHTANSTAGNVVAGHQTFTQNCAGCHGEAGEGKVGPRLKGIPHDDDEITASIRTGSPGKMPAFGGKLSAGQITDLIAFLRSLGPRMAEAEHHHTPGMDHDHAAGHKHGMAGMPGMAGMAHGMEAPAVAGQEMSREGSGTSWQPESSPMWAKHAMWGKWAVMQHGNVFVMYDAQSGSRGASRPVSTNWYMLMGDRPVGKGDLMLRGMFSLEPVTIGGNGQPQLFQTGEGLTDRQHPHDLFMELASQYSYPLSSKLGGYLYVAPVGEPALGPTAFMHRVSAMEIPTAPLVHHWTDSTHISFGVLTAGVQSERWKSEVSWFNGHEPDRNRWDIDDLALNSYSGRISYAPSRDWVLQVSRGHIDRPEVYYTPQLGSVDRTTVSAQHVRRLRDGYWATTFVWGRNEGGQGGAHGSSDGFLLESNYNWAERNHLFGRIERVDKDELFPEGDPRTNRQFLVNAFSLGYARDIGHSKSFETALGAMVTVYAKDSALDRAYGDFPVGVQVFLRIRPRRMAMHSLGEGMSPEHEHGGHQHSGASSPAPFRLTGLLVRQLSGSFPAGVGPEAPR